MKKMFSRSKVLLWIVLCLSVGTFLVWSSDQRKFDGCDMVVWEDGGRDPFGTIGDESSWRRYVPDAILDIFDSSDDGRHVRMYLPEQQQTELKRIFDSYDLLHDGSSAGGFPFIGTFGDFVVPIGERSYLLTMYYNGPVPGGSYDVKGFSLSEIEITRRGHIVDSSKEISGVREFELPELYDQLEQFFKNLPSSNPGRAQYDSSRKSMEKLISYHKMNRDSKGTAGDVNP